ncbi:MAG TPA: hotdog domain-containing protein [Arenicellales bacterium]|jgi:4-hydroxybenzoyl-CoA thioesterase|nr:hotdog domain-containing protein [Arenicellales bacterium]|tara:strand:+ start:93 stop:569 length:477 start_codon:yes stop_codon:yes gene_type:complete
MAMYWREISVPWGESDPFGLVYYPRIVAWFNDTEHELFRTIGYPVDQMIRQDRTTFVMGEIHFRFIGPAAYGDRVMTKISLEQIGERTLHWNCVAANHASGDLICEGRAVRVYARIQEDGNLKSFPIPDSMRKTLEDLGTVDQLGDGLIPPPGLQPEE